MLLTMAVTLYTSRIILKVLGVEDFGIYNVVGGFVVMLGFLNNAMASATQRFLSFEIGKENRKQLQNVFSMSVNIHFIIMVIILIFSETIGIWFVKTQLIIPAERLLAAKWVFQFSILTLMVNIISVPYNAMIIAQERMNVFAWVSIVEVVLKLFVVIMLQWYGADKLILYSVLIFIISLIIRIIYGIYCGRNFIESKFKIYWDKKLFKLMINYAGWNLWGDAAVTIMGQGINVLLNMFFGPVVNAARGIAYQLNGAINRFVSNFQMAMRPQIIKSYAINDLKYMHQLIYQGAKYSYFLLLFLSLPVIMETPLILQLWLTKVPEYTITFTRLVIINNLINSISGPLMTAAQASGKIKVYQGIVGGLLLLNLPVSYIFLKLGFSPYVTFYVSIGFSLIALYIRLIIVSPLVKLSKITFLKNVIYKIIFVSFTAVVLPAIFAIFIHEGILKLIIIVVASIISTGSSIYFIGLGKNEKLYLINLIKKYLGKIKK